MFANLNRQLLHENSSAQLQFNQIWNIWNHWVDSAWTGTTTGTVTFHLLGWTTTRLPLHVVVPSQRSAFAVDSQYATRSTSSLIVDTAASYSNLEHRLDLLAGSPVCFSESVRFSAFRTPNGTRGYSTLE